MSGTSADAVDVVVVDFSHNKTELFGSYSQPLDSGLRQQIHSLTTPNINEIDRLGQLDRQLAELFAQSIFYLLDKLGLNPQQILAVGSHGQTIRHRPPGTQETPFTLQIGDPNIIAERTRITTVADFRRRDMAAGGHGAPLVPAFHQAVFQSESIDRGVVNIGGMANITWLPTSGKTLGFDTGPGNVLMDAWTLLHRGKAYDTNGEWAASGRVDTELLTRLLSHEFFSQSPPKSTGRELFNLEWLARQTKNKPLSPADVQATLLALTTQSIANDLNKLSTKDCEIYICGGGAYNKTLMKDLARLLPQMKIETTEALGMSPQWVEAMAFAWLARQTMKREAGNLPAVTGAHREVILGGVYFA
jgi:anhydro-N-acetylmuramic acid kinase